MQTPEKKSYNDSIAIRNRLQQRKTIHLQKLRRETDRIAAQAARMGAKKAVLFGSFSRGDAGIFSDLDILIIIESELDFLKRTADAYNRLKPEVAMDILVYTPKELQVMLARKNKFIQRILTEGQVIYEA